MYDLAGNAWEWTMEAESPSDRVMRGGTSGQGGGYRPASTRVYNNPSASASSINSFRLALYVKS